MKSASRSDRRYFERVARFNRSLTIDPPPKSLKEMFDRLELMERQLGQLAQPGQAGVGDGDLDSHLIFIQRLHAIEFAHSA